MKNKLETPTPRTDALALDNIKDRWGSNNCMVVWAKHARQLEAELTAASKRLDKLENYNGTIDQLTAQISELQEQLTTTKAELVIARRRIAEYLPYAEAAMKLT